MFSSLLFFEYFIYWFPVYNTGIFVYFLRLLILSLNLIDNLYIRLVNWNKIIEELL